MTVIGADSPRVRAAMRLIEAVMWRRSGDGDIGVSGELNQRLRDDAAMTLLRRVLGALSGLDVEREAVGWVSALPVLVTRDLADRLKAAVCNERVAAALDAEIGGDAASVLLGEVMMF